MCMPTLVRSEKMLNKVNHSAHLAALIEEISDLKYSNRKLWSRIENTAEVVLDCLNRAVVPVDILRGPLFNPVLDPKKNFYGLNLNTYRDDSMDILNFSTNIMKILEISRESMDKKSLWKVFLSTIFLELTSEEAYTDLTIGSDIMIDNRRADFVVYGTDCNIRLIVRVNENSEGFNTRKLEEMMSSALIDIYNDYSHWPLIELRNLSVYGLIICGNDFQICRMALNVEKGVKLAMLFTQGKRVDPYHLFNFKKLKSGDDLCSQFANMDINGDKIVLKNPNRGSVAAVIGLMQTVLWIDDLILGKRCEFLEDDYYD